MSETTGAAPTATDTGSSEAVSTEANVEGQEGQEGQTQAEIKSMKEKFLLKVDGEEFEEEIDLANKEDLKRRLQLAHAARKRMESAKAAMEQANKEREQSLKLMKMLNENPEEVLAKIGPKGLEAAKNLIRKQIMEERMTPQQREYRDRMAELERYKAQEKKAKEDAEAQEAEARIDHYRKELEAEIIETIKASKLPVNAANVGMVAEVRKKVLDAGLDLSFSEIVQEVKKRARANLLAMMGDGDGDAIIELLGDDAVKRVRKADIKRLTAPTSDLFGDRPKAKEEAPRPKDARPLSIDEWREQVNKRVQG